MNWLKAASASVLLVSAQPLFADEVTEQIDLAKQYYENGDLSGAISELEFAVGTLRKQTMELYMATLPEPPAGWTADPPKVESYDTVLRGGAMIARKYRQQGGPGSVKFGVIVIDGNFLSAFATMFTNPAFLGSNPDYRRTRIGRENAFLKWQEKSGDGELKLIVGGRIIVDLEGRDLKQEDVLIDLIRRWDLKKAKAIAGL